jgi:hypothetical protein
VVLALALALCPALTGAAGARLVTFGSTLSKPPTDFDPPATCDTTGSNQDIGPCTRVAVRFAATGAVRGRVRAPVAGTIRRIRVRAGLGGTFRVTLVRLRSFDRASGSGEGQAVSGGATIRVRGRGLAARRPIESFTVRLRARRGDYLAVEGSSTSALRCEGGDVEQLLFMPPLRALQPFQPSAEFDSCTLLVQATIVTPRRARRRR